jgi:serine/threonine protein kinase
VKERTVWEVYTKDRKLGSGMTGDVFLVRHKITNQEFAVKSMERRKINPDLYEDLKNEISILQMVRPLVPRRRAGVAWPCCASLCATIERP